MAMGEPEYQVRSVNRAIDILELLVREPGQTLTQLAQALDMPKSTCFNIVNTLVARGLVTADAVTGRFRLGVGTIHLGGAYLAQQDVRQVARPHMEKLVALTRETSNLAVLQEPDLEVIYIDKVDSPESVALTAGLGRRDAAYCTALGKALLAFLPPERLDRYLKTTRLVAHTSRTITDPAALRRHLEEVRRQGYAVNNCEMDNEGFGIAAPLFDHTGAATAAISLAGPVHRLTPERSRSLTELVLATAAEISRSLGAARA